MFISMAVFHDQGDLDLIVLDTAGAEQWVHHHCQKVTLPKIYSN